MANFSVALLVCSLMKTARQQEKGVPSEGEGTAPSIRGRAGGRRWPRDVPAPSGCPPRKAPPWHPDAEPGAADAVGCQGAPPCRSPTGWGPELARQMPQTGFPNSPPPEFLCKEFKMSLLRHLQGDRIENSFVPGASCLARGDGWRLARLGMEIFSVMKISP